MPFDVKPLLVLFCRCEILCNIITVRYDFEQNCIKGDYLVVFNFMEELRAIAHTYPQKKAGAVKCANRTIAFE